MAAYLYVTQLASLQIKKLQIKKLQLKKLQNLLNKDFHELNRLRYLKEQDENAFSKRHSQWKKNSIFWWVLLTSPSRDLVKCFYCSAFNLLLWIELNWRKMLYALLLSYQSCIQKLNDLTNIDQTNPDWLPSANWTDKLNNGIQWILALGIFKARVHRENWKEIHNLKLCHGNIRFRNWHQCEILYCLTWEIIAVSL